MTEFHASAHAAIRSSTKASRDSASRQMNYSSELGVGLATKRSEESTARRCLGIRMSGFSSHSRDQLKSSPFQAPTAALEGALLNLNCASALQ